MMSGGWVSLVPQLDARHHSRNMQSTHPMATAVYKTTKPRCSPPASTFKASDRQMLALPCFGRDIPAGRHLTLRLARLWPAIGAQPPTCSSWVPGCMRPGAYWIAAMCTTATATAVWCCTAPETFSQDCTCVAKQQSLPCRAEPVLGQRSTFGAIAFEVGWLAGHSRLRPTHQPPALINNPAAHHQPACTASCTAACNHRTTQLCCCRHLPPPSQCHPPPAIREPSQYCWNASLSQTTPSATPRPQHQP